MFNKNIITSIPMGYCDSNAVGTNARALVRLDATSDEYAIIMRVQKDMTVDEIALVVDTVVGAPTYRVSIQGVNLVNGDPDGTIKGGGSPASTDWAPTVTGLQWITLDNSFALSVEDLIAIVVEDGTTGTNPDGSNYIEIAASDVQIAQNSLPYVATSTDTGATWTPITQDMPSAGLRNSSTTDDVQGFPIESWNVAIPDNYALASGYISAAKFKLPGRMGKRFKVGGLFIKNSYFTGDIEVGIWDSSGVEIVSAALDKDVQSNSAGQQIMHFATPTWINAETQYYAGIRLTSAGIASIFIHDLVTNDNTSAVKGYPDLGVVSSLWNTSAWVDNVGQVPIEVTLLLTDLDKTSDGIQSIGTVEA